jgi:hypothetical protein
LLKTENSLLKLTKLSGGLMKTTLLIILLTHHGCWLGDSVGRISVQWAIERKMPPANLQWELMFGPIRLAGDQINMADGTAPAIVSLKIPPVRVRTELQWVYRVTPRDGGQSLASGQELINAFPPVSLEDAKLRLKGNNLFVVDVPSGLPAILKKAKIDVTRVDNANQLQAVRADVILVGADQLSDSPFAQAPLLAQAKAGAQVLILRQTRPMTLCGFALARRAVPSKMVWRGEHPLFASLDEHDLQSWLDADAGDLWAIRMPADAPVLDLAYWPQETPGAAPASTDALVAVQAMGKGRIVLCQLPLGSWEDDPRSQLLLMNSLNYLLTRPEPTPPPSQPCPEQPPRALHDRTIRIPSGAVP